MSWKKGLPWRLDDLREKFFSWLERNLLASQLGVGAKTYLLEALKYAALAGAGAWFAAMLLGQSLVNGFFLGAGFTVLGLGLAVYYPAMKKGKLAGIVEKHLPFALMSMSVELNMNLTFEKSIENLAKGDYGLLSKEFARVYSDVRDSGSSIQEALFSLSERIDSSMLRRAISQLVNLYEQGHRGKSGEPVRQLAKEMLLKQKAESKEFSGKMAMFSLMFIVASAIMPALFQAMVVVGSMFMKMGFTPFQALLIAAVGFPLVDLIILAVIRSKTPIFLRDIA